MPQLNPTPWLSTFICTWLVLLTAMPLKVLTHTLPAEPTAQSAETPKTDPWEWTCQ
uniref:ATP synthase complex subunit 8 n=1 Tax=Parupeneus chrysopleuron TaxID=1772269 RepID=A0A0U3CLM0_9TELE|nr:ATP synthase F0 subunit 8 [Parupeneus chrysopleuron]ALT66144.1 ATPase subunit 8 [Parupeneus chrysopleuron]WGO62551.1 ATP synthase F0 subunit 8 [Parupeneus chrysopleuron]